MFKKFLILLILFLLVGFSYTKESYAKKSVKLSDKKNNSQKQPLKGSSVLNINSDQIEYFQEKDQVIANGHVKVQQEGNDAVIESEKMTYDRSNDLIIAEKNVKITKNGNIINGDYARINLATDSSLIENPNTEISIIKIDAKTAKIYPKQGDENKKNIDALKGKAVFSDQTLNYILSTSNTKYITDPTIVSKPLNKNSKAGLKLKYKIHSKKVIVKREKNVDIITLLNSTISINRYPIAKISSLTLTTNKETNQIETNFPELGRKHELGGYLGWGPVFNLPSGSTFKLAPIVTLDRGVGIGGLSRFTSATNKTELAYSTLKKKFVIEGEQQLPFSSKTKIQYGRNSYIENGFFGKQLPALIIEAVDDRKLASALNFDFDLRSSAAYIQEDHRWSTGRFQEQGNLYNKVPLIKLGKHASIGASSQFDIAVYGTGDTYGVLRAGPSIATEMGPLYAWLSYYQGGIYGKTPLLSDRFYYGKSNVTLRSRYKLNKYVTLGYESSLNLSKNNYDKKLLAENQIFCWFGPDDFKVRIGYDTRRSQPTFDFNMLLGSDRSSIEFDKLKITEN